VDEFENEPDVRCLAAPIRDKNGDVIAAISISGPSFRMVREKIEKDFIPALLETARKISLRLGFVD
jgi:DNA-binding IclR family transcriptional regulator